MATGNRVELVFAGDDSALQKSFDKVGAGAKTMADDVGSASKRMVDDSTAAGAGMGDRIGDTEGKFQGLASTINGTGDVMEGFKTGNVATMAMGFADLADGISKSVMPALMFMKTTLLTGLAPALTMISAHPLIAGLLIGGAIIAGLILLEKKFGVVSGAARAVGEAFSAAWDLIKKGWNATVGGFRFNVAIPDWVPLVGGKSFGFTIPNMHTGGIAGRDMLAVLQQGEQVVARGQPGGAGAGITINVAGSVITERDLGRIVADALRSNRLIGVAV